MLSIFNPLRELTMASITLRVLLAVFCGGLVGIEREYKCRPAGFRTHILICLGAAMTTLTSQYLSLYMNYNTDLTRLGAQVISGIGFIGAGSIIVTKRKRIKGLTTAAGLWSVAIIGLSCGAGYYEGAICATLLILFAELFFTRLEYRVIINVRDTTLYIEYDNSDRINDVIRYLKQFNIKITDLELTRMSQGFEKKVVTIISLQFKKNIDYRKVIGDISIIDGVLSVEEL